MKTLYILMVLFISLGVIKNLNKNNQSDIIVNKEIDLIFSQLKEKT